MGFIGQASCPKGNRYIPPDVTSLSGPLAGRLYDLPDDLLEQKLNAFLSRLARMAEEFVGIGIIFLKAITWI